MGGAEWGRSKQWEGRYVRCSVAEKGGKGTHSGKGRKRRNKGRKKATEKCEEQEKREKEQESGNGNEHKMKEVRKDARDGEQAKRGK